MQYKLSLIEIENLGPISKLRVDWQMGDILVFKGKNGTGKTTATSHLSQLLQNSSMPEPLKKGAEKGFFKAILKNEDGEDTEILHKFDKDGETLTVIMPNGHAMADAKQKTFLSRLAQDKRSFYMPDYLEVTAPQKRQEMILKLFPPEVANAMVSATNALKEARDKRRKAYGDKELQKGKAVVYDEALAAKQAVSVIALSDERATIIKRNSDFERAIEAKKELDGLIDQTAKVAVHAQSIVDLKTSTDARIEARNKRMEEEIARAKRECEEDCEAINADFDSGQKHHNSKIHEITENEKAAKERHSKATAWLNDPQNNPKPLDEIDSKINDSEAENERISNAKRIKSEHETLKTLTTVWEGLDSKCKEAEVALRVKMTEAQLPAGLGIEIDEDAILSLTLGGVPLEQSSSSERTISQLHLSLLSMGELGFIRFDGTLVDDSNMAQVMQWLKDHDYQAAIEIMERSGAKTVTYEVADRYFDLGSETPTDAAVKPIGDSPLLFD